MIYERSFTRILNEKKQNICTIYRRYDSQYDTYGLALSTFLSEVVMTNGFNQNLILKGLKTASNMGCLASQIVLLFKTDIDNHMIYHKDVKLYAEVQYIIYINKNYVLKLKVLEGDGNDLKKHKIVFNDIPQKFNKGNK